MVVLGGGAVSYERGTPVLAFTPAAVQGPVRLWGPVTRRDFVFWRHTLDAPCHGLHVTTQKVDPASGPSERASPSFAFTPARSMGAFRPLEATARKSEKYRANPILPLSLYQKVHLNVTAMREYEFLGVS